MKGSYQKIIVAAVVALAGAAIIFGVLVLQRLERMTQVAERTEEKLDRIIEATAPLGKEAVARGVDALREVDTEQLGKSATEGIKEIGAAGKKRLLEYLDTKQTEGVQEHSSDK